MNHQAYRVPTWLEQSANAPGVDPKAIGLHNRLNGAIERGDAMASLRLLWSAGIYLKSVRNRTPKTGETPIEPSGVAVPIRGVVELYYRLTPRPLALGCAKYVSK